MGTEPVRLASKAEMDRIFNDVDTGASPPLQHWKGVEVIMDETMRVDGLIMIQGGTHQATIWLTFNEWFGMVRPRVGAFTELDQLASNQSCVDLEDIGMGAQATDSPGSLVTSAGSTWSLVLHGSTKLSCQPRWLAVACPLGGQSSRHTYWYCSGSGS